MLRVLLETRGPAAEETDVGTGQTARQERGHRETGKRSWERKLAGKSLAIELGDMTLRAEPEASGLCG